MAQIRVLFVLFQSYGNDISLLTRRVGTLAARSEVLETLEDKENSWFEGLGDESLKATWMRRVYPRVDNTQAPWTVEFRQPSQGIHTSRKA